MNSDSHRYEADQHGGFGYYRESYRDCSNREQRRRLSRSRSRSSSSSSCPLAYCMNNNDRPAPPIPIVFVSGSSGRVAPHHSLQQHQPHQHSADELTFYYDNQHGNFEPSLNPCLSSGVSFMSHPADERYDLHIKGYQSRESSARYHHHCQQHMHQEQQHRFTSCAGGSARVTPPNTPRPCTSSDERTVCRTPSALTVSFHDSQSSLCSGSAVSFADDKTNTISNLSPAWPTDSSSSSMSSLYTSNARRSSLPHRNQNDHYCDDLQINIAPGMTDRLRGAKETFKCIEDDFYLHVQCYGCADNICCILDASFVLCPHCKVVSPIEGNEEIQGGVGLGFSVEDLHNWQYEIRLRDRAAEF